MANRTFPQLCKIVSESSGIPSASGTGDRGAYLSGLAINEEILYQNTIPWWFLERTADLTLVSGSKTYSLSTNWPAFRTHIVSVVLNAAATARDTFVTYLEPEEFFRAGFHTGINSGIPRWLTVDTYNDLIRIDADPSTDGNGRILRTLYRKVMPALTGSATLGVDDVAEDLIIQGAKWRVRQLAALGDWRDYREIAKDTERRLLATLQSTDYLALGIFR